MSIYVSTKVSLLDSCTLMTRILTTEILTLESYQTGNTLGTQKSNSVAGASLYQQVSQLLRIMLAYKENLWQPLSIKASMSNLKWCYITHNYVLTLFQRQGKTMFAICPYISFNLKLIKRIKWVICRAGITMFITS